MKTRQSVIPFLAAVIVSAATQFAPAVPVTFTNINVSNSNQSRINLVATAAFNGVPLTSAPQYAPGGLNGNGSESTLYHQTATNTPSNMATDLSLFSVEFPGGGTAMAANTTGLLNNNLAIAPGVGGASGTAPADYGTIFTSPQDIAVPPIDVSGLGIPGLTTLNLGTLTGINLNVALRNIVLDLHSGSLPLSGGGSYPAQFDSTQVGVTLSGTSDMSLTATLKQDNLNNWLTTGAALLALQQGLAGQGITITTTGSIFNLTYQVGIGFSSPLPAADFLNTDASQGKLEHVGANLRLTLPVKFDVDATTLPAPLDTLITAHFTMSGQLIGQAPFQALPEPSSIGLLLCGLASVTALSRRRRCNLR